MPTLVRPDIGLAVLNKILVRPVPYRPIGRLRRHCRCMAVEVKCGPSIFICVAVYFPVFENIDTDEYEENILLCSAFIDSICSQYPSDQNVKLVICGDFNFDMLRLNTIARLNIIRELFNEFNPCSCYHLDVNNVCYTFK